MTKKPKKEILTILIIFLIAIISLVAFYKMFFFKIENKKDYQQNINNQDTTLETTDVDIKEIEKRLNELDIDLDDIIEELD